MYVIECLDSTLNLNLYWVSTLGPSALDFFLRGNFIPWLREATLYHKDVLPALKSRVTEMNNGAIVLPYRDKVTFSIREISMTVNPDPVKLSP